MFENRMLSISKAYDSVLQLSTRVTTRENMNTKKPRERSSTMSTGGYKKYIRIAESKCCRRELRIRQFTHNSRK